MTRAMRSSWWLFVLVAGAAALACSDGSYRLGTGRDKSGGGNAGAAGFGASGSSGVAGNTSITGGAAGVGAGGAAAGVAGVAGVAGAGGAGGSDGSAGADGCPSDCAGMSFFERPTRANVVLAVDTAATPAEVLQNVELALNGFAQRFTSNWLELRLVVLARQQPPGICVPAPLGSGACAPQGADSLPPTLYHHPSAIIDDGNALQVIIEEFPVFSPKLEATQPSTLIVVTGGDAAASPLNDPGAFERAYTALTRQPWKMAAYYAASSCEGTPSGGRVYGEIAERTGGVQAGICTESAQTAFLRIASSIFDRVLPCTIDIPDLGPNPPFNRDLVNMKLHGPEIDRVLPYLLSADGCDGRSGGWYFDDPMSPTLLFLCPESCALMRSSPGAELEQTFGCPTVGYPGCN